MGGPDALVVATDPALRDRVVGGLERAGYRVAWTSDGKTAVAATVMLVIADLAALADLAAQRDRLDGDPAIVALVEGVAEAHLALDGGALDAWPRGASEADLELRIAATGRILGERRAMAAMFRNLPNDAMLLDKQGKILWFNREVPGAERGGMVGRNGLELIQPEDRARVRAAFETGARTGEGQIFEATSLFGMTYRFHLMPILRHKRFDGAVAAAFDLTEQRWTEAELKVQSTRATSILSALPELVFWLRRGGEFLDVHVGDESKLLFPPGRIVGSRAQDLLPPGLAATLLEAVDAALTTREVQVAEYTLPIGGRALEFEARIIASGEDQAVCLVRDITERSRMQAQLAIADRLAALGTLAAGVAHEINNPLTYILIGVESVAKELRKRAAEPLGERAAILVGRLEGALEGARRVRRIVADLKAFARGDEEGAGPIDVRTILDGVASLVDSQIRYRGRLVRAYDDVPLVAASGDRLNQVFLNLLINAAQALPDGGATDSVIRLGVSRTPDGRVAVEVSDTGHGISPEDLGRIFDPFFTTKPVGVGTGLGLWICHRIVTSLGGEIQVESHVGVGTSVRVLLPIASEARPAESRPVEVELARGAGRILVIDDEAQVASAIGLLFEASEVVTATSGQSALDELARGREFDWIFCDLIMPGLSGMEIHDRIRAAWPGLEDRMVFMTGGAFTPQASEFVASTDCPVLLKPFRPQDVAELLTRRGQVLAQRAAARSLGASS